ncbi:YihY/virulence factor BrkB family protein [Flavobacteriaceae bacterium]|nr:YihY/virulence factor BrkB family protein [Flavobacteriaceae bacterium]
MKFELENLPIVRQLLIVLKKFKIPGFRGMSLYDLLETYIVGIIRGALTTRASGVSFSFFMAIFPFLLFILTLIPYIPIVDFQSNFIGFIEQVLPPKTYDAVQGVISDIINNRYGGLLSFGFFGSIFLMANGVNAIFGSFEYSYHDVNARNVFRSYVIALGISLLMSFILIITVTGIIALQYLMVYFKDHGWLDDVKIWIDLGQQLIFLLSVLITVSILYYFGTKEGKHQPFFSPGSVMTTLLSIGTIYFFGIYIDKFSRYNELYGSIGTLLIIMLFIWLNSIILLLGYELNASILGLKKRSNTRNDKIF